MKRNPSSSTFEAVTKKNGSSGKAAAACLSRQVSMYLAKYVGGWSLPKLGRFDNGRHHTIVLHAIAKIERLRKTEEAFDSLIDVLIATLTSETKNCRAETSVSLSHSELIGAVAVRVIHRLKQLIPERLEQSDSHAILAQLGAAKLPAAMASHATDSAGQPSICRNIFALELALTALRYAGA